MTTTHPTQRETFTNQVEPLREFYDETKTTRQILGRAIHQFMTYHPLRGYKRRNAIQSTYEGMRTFVANVLREYEPTTPALPDDNRDTLTPFNRENLELDELAQWSGSYTWAKEVLEYVEAHVMELTLFRLMTTAAKKAVDRSVENQPEPKRSSLPWRSDDSMQRMEEVPVGSLAEGRPSSTRAAMKELFDVFKNRNQDGESSDPPQKQVDLEDPSDSDKIKEILQIVIATETMLKDQPSQLRTQSPTKAQKDRAEQQNNENRALKDTNEELRRQLHAARLQIAQLRLQETQGGGDDSSETLAADEDDWVYDEIFGDGDSDDDEDFGDGTEYEYRQPAWCGTRTVLDQ